MRAKDEERTHRSRPATRFAMLNSSWRPGGCKDVDPEIELASAGSKDHNGELSAVRTRSGENTGGETKLRMTAASTSDVGG